MVFIYKKSLLGVGGRMLVSVVLDASFDFKVGDAVSTGTADEAIAASSGLRILGIIAAIVTKGGVSPSSDGCGGAFVDAFRTAASNETVGQITALVDVSPYSLYSVNLDDTIGTTTGSNKRFYFFDLDTGVVQNKLNEASAGTTNGQFFSWGLDPSNTDRVIVNIAESIFRKSDTQ